MVTIFRLYRVACGTPGIHEVVDDTPATLFSHLDGALDAPHLPQERHQQARLAAPGRPVHANQLPRVNLQRYLPQGGERGG